MQEVYLHVSVKLAWALANREACATGFLRIEPIHFLLAVFEIADDRSLFLKEIEGLSPEEMGEISTYSAECLQALNRALNIDVDQARYIRRKIKASLAEEGDPIPPRMLHRSKASRRLFERAVERAFRENSKCLTIMFLLQVLLENPPEEFTNLLETGSEVDGAGRTDIPTDEPSAKAAMEGLSLRDKRPLSLLGSIGRDLTDLARRNLLPPVIGRVREMTTLARFLQRTIKRNVLIIGEAGVGKTALVEGLAQRLASVGAPPKLAALRFLQVNVSDLIAGTKYRGDLEERLQKLVSEAVANPHLVLFFDEIHLMLGGDGGGAMDIANILKPALMREGFSCIGATTVDEYERHVKDDPAFLRRFQVLRLPEPTREEAVEICRAWARRLEERQGVQIDDSAVVAAVELSDDLIINRSLPDKAIDLLEDAAARSIVSTLSFSGKPVSKEKPKIEKDNIRALLEEQYGVVAGASGDIDVNAARRALQAEIVGQEKAIEAVVNTLSTLAAKEAGAKHPVAVMLLVGPTGVGKTLTAECLGKSLFGNAFIRFNMNEFAESHELGRLIGAPPGFVGHQRQGALFRFAEVYPRGLILLDEMEKAHPEVRDYFLQIFDKGEATDSRGRQADFRRFLFAMTSNIPLTESLAPKIGFSKEGDLDKELNSRFLEELLEKHFRREFLARIDGIVVFQHLQRDGYARLLDRRLFQWTAAIESLHGIKLVFSGETKDNLVELGVEQKEGARGFLRLIEKMFQPSFQDFIRSSQVRGEVVVDISGNRFEFSVAEE